MRIPLWLLLSIEILAVLTIVSALCWKRIQDTYLRVILIVRLICQRLKHRGYKDVGARFRLEEDTLANLRKDLQANHAEIERLNKRVAELKEDKLRDEQKGDKKE